MKNFDKLIGESEYIVVSNNKYIVYYPCIINSNVKKRKFL